ncbi:hypothetical protein HRbin20_01495 [bacterium HR20]|nr:hypothetical protein HRbin20_01495 [bacterium HR20]
MTVVRSGCLPGRRIRQHNPQYDFLRASAKVDERDANYCRIPSPLVELARCRVTDRNQNVKTRRLRCNGDGEYKHNKWVHHDTHGRLRKLFDIITTCW